MADLVIDIYHGDEVHDSNGIHEMWDAGVRAIIHKASEGWAYTDSAYAKRYTRVTGATFKETDGKPAKMLWGSYHFASAGSPLSQADKYLRICAPKTNELICLDWEENSRAGTMSRSDAEKFVQRILEKTGRYPTLYCSWSFINERFPTGDARSSILSRCPLWIARYGNKPGKLPKWTYSFEGSPWILHQYTESAHLPGCDGTGDSNKFIGTKAQLLSKWPFS